MVMTPTDEPMKAQMQTNDLTLPDIEQLLKATENKAPVKGQKSTQSTQELDHSTR